jgi:hypothetical protein
VAFLTILTFLPVGLSAQYGTAPNNYYPENYNGSIFKGVVTDTADNHVTLTFTNGSKTESFTALRESSKPGVPFLLGMAAA